MWTKERELWAEEDKRIREKIAEININTKEFLLK